MDRVHIPLWYDLAILDPFTRVLTRRKTHLKRGHPCYGWKEKRTKAAMWSRRRYRGMRPQERWPIDKLCVSRWVRLSEKQGIPESGQRTCNQNMRKKCCFWTFEWGMSACLFDQQEIQPPSLYLLNISDQTEPQDARNQVRFVHAGSSFQTQTQTQTLSEPKLRLSLL
jgi:hypothetical protein